MLALILITFDSIKTADSKNLKGLLIRRTLHTTVPNIIIGGRSIGGADDLERLEKSGELKLILEASGVIVKSH